MQVLLRAAVLAPVVLLAACDGPAPPVQAGAPEKVWQTDGFKNPESVLFDAAGAILYVSNVNGEPTGKDGNGFISTVTPGGDVKALEWVSGMNAPKGLALSGGKLYVADIDQLVEIDVAGAKIANRYDAKDAKFLNDVAVDGAGNIYVSDMAANTIWRLSGGTFEVWLQDAKLENPNGLLVEGDKLIVGSWGVMTDGFATKVPGHMKQVSLADKSISALGSGAPAGNLDGIEPLGGGEYLVTDWMAGKVLKIDSAGSTKELLDLGQGAADLGYDAKTGTAFIPQMMKNSIYAYKVK